MITLQEKRTADIAVPKLRHGRDRLDYQRLETVLLIEDDRELNDVLSQRFRRAGLMVARAFDGPSGLEKLKLLEPDVVVLDLGLPRMDGSKILHHLRMDAGMRLAPVLVITGSSNESLIQKAEHWGVTRILRKPVSPKALVEAALDALEGV